MTTTVGSFAVGGLLHVVGEPPVEPGSAVVSSVAGADAGWVLAGELPERRRLLVTVPADAPPVDLDGALRELARLGTVAVSLAGDASDLDLDAVAATAAAHGVITVAARAAMSATQLAGVLSARQAEVYRSRSEITAEIADQVGALFREGEGPRRLLDYVQQTTGARLDVLASGSVLREELAQAPEACLDLLGQGRIPSRAYRTPGPPTVRDAAQVRGDGPWHVALYPLQSVRAAPLPVLYARTPGHFAPYTLDLLQQTSHFVGVLYEGRRRGETAASEAATRAAILQYLMLGQVSHAVRVGERLAPGVLSRDAGRIAIVECGRGERREDVAEACATVVTPSLIAPCPAYDRHLILALPDDQAGDQAAHQVLSQLAGSDRAVGVSTVRPWPRTVLSYQSAYRALTAARASPARIALNEGEMVASLLPESARVWGRALCSRLEALPAQSRDLAVHTAMVALGHGATAAGQMMGIERTAAGARLSTVMSAMGLTRGRLIHRAVADLALQLNSLPLDEEEGPADGPAPDLAAVLAQAETARTWAAHYLAPLDERLLAALTAWLSAGSIAAAAEALDVHRSSMDRWLDRASTLLSRDLSAASGEGPHDPLWALLLAGHLSPEVLPAT